MGNASSKEFSLVQSISSHRLQQRHLTVTTRTFRSHDARNVLYGILRGNCVTEFMLPGFMFRWRIALLLLNLLVEVSPHKFLIHGCLYSRGRPGMILKQRRDDGRQGLITQIVN